MTSNDFTSIDVFCALDVGKSAHHGTALPADGRTVFDKPLPNGEHRARELFARLGRRGKVLVVVDQPDVGTSVVAVARASGCEVAYLPGLSMRRLADCHPGTGKTDVHNAALICLTRRRVDVLHAMLKHRTPYQPGHEQAALPSPQTLIEQIEAPLRTTV
ncbi:MULTISPECIES: transposase [unclassified Streptomyces]|uniref:IS110 family transposase n=1 Tax=unclassified Streptomyces TaxID=2593676 RepID=UPI002254A760|nr:MULTISPECIES: transposase [unclassified Streptomyces]MCX5328587.1 IS110 family transposase [Streptomyces sp. NBC_00140]MCX5357997.1 IS110 family transposase [Streptomyces sp. NBC_00124]